MARRQQKAGKSSKGAKPEGKPHLNQERMMVIVNPVAGAGASEALWKDIERAMKDLRLDFHYGFTEYPGHAVELAWNAARSGFGCVVAVGGDGTVFEVVNGILSAGLEEIPMLGIVPTGRGADFSSSLGIPADWQIAVSILASGRKRKVDAVSIEYMESGNLKRGYFVNIAGVGFEAELLKRANALRPELSRMASGRLSYYASLIPSITALREREMEVHVDEEVFRVVAVSVIVANGSHFGGKMRVAPEASPDDGFLEVIVVGAGMRSPIVDLPPEEPIPAKGRIRGAVSFARSLRSILGIYSGGALESDSSLRLRARKARVICDDRMALHADGEIIGEAPFGADVVDGALTVMA